MIGKFSGLAKPIIDAAQAEKVARRVRRFDASGNTGQLRKLLSISDGQDKERFDLVDGVLRSIGIERKPFLFLSNKKGSTP